MLAVSALLWVGFVSSGFLQLPPGVEIGAMSGVAVDSSDRVYVLHRGPVPVLQFDHAGKYVRGWGEGLFQVAHGLRIDRQGNVWTTDNGNHLIRKFSPAGTLLLTLGGTAELGFRAPDDLVFASTGEIFVADAGNGRIVKLSPEGRFVSAWGRKGKGEGEFATAHGLAIDSRDRIYVADRGNHRVQVFDRDGKFAAAWTGFGNPFGLAVSGNELIVSDGDLHRMSHLGLASGSLLRQWGDPATLLLPHILALDSRGRLYVAEVNGKRVQIFQSARQASPR